MQNEGHVLYFKVSLSSTKLLAMNKENIFALHNGY